MDDSLDVRSPIIFAGQRKGKGHVRSNRNARLVLRERMLMGGFLHAGAGRYIGIDLGTRTGIAQFDAREHERPDCVDVCLLRLTPDKGEDPGLRPLRFRRFLEWLLDRNPRTVPVSNIPRRKQRAPGAAPLFRGGPVLSVAYERVHQHTGVYAAQVYGQLQGTLLAECAKRGIRCTPIPVSMGKLAATGNGQAMKPHVRLAVSEHFRPWCARLRTDAPVSYDEADALSILMASLMRLDQVDTPVS